jgi:hypothetical protein
MFAPLGVVWLASGLLVPPRDTEDAWLFPRCRQRSLQHARVRAADEDDRGPGGSFVLLFVCATGLAASSVNATKGMR